MNTGWFVDFNDVFGYPQGGLGDWRRIKLGETRKIYILFRKFCWFSAKTGEIRNAKRLISGLTPRSTTCSFFLVKSRECATVVFETFCPAGSRWRRKMPLDKCNTLELYREQQNRRIYRQDQRFGSIFGRDTAKISAKPTPCRLVRSVGKEGCRLL